MNLLDDWDNKRAVHHLPKSTRKPVDMGKHHLDQYTNVGTTSEACGIWEILPNIGLSDINVNRPSLNWHFGSPEI
jgi:hypothetical protein